MTGRRSTGNSVGRSLPGIPGLIRVIFLQNLPGSGDDPSRLSAEAHFEGPTMMSRKLTGFLIWDLLEKGRSYLTYREWKSRTIWWLDKMLMQC
jgi:hypothetical protein